MSSSPVERRQHLDAPTLVLKGLGVGQARRYGRRQEAEEITIRLVQRQARARPNDQQRRRLEEPGTTSGKLIAAFGGSS